VDPAGEEFGEERLILLVKSLAGASAAAIVAEIQTAVEQWAAGQPASDDITVVAVRRVG
jgi:sigma-B regulation protein RsbU (phosphoserine phosphatase)